MAADVQVPVTTAREANEKLRKAILRDIYNSEELKISSRRCKLLKETTEVLCAGPDNVKFNETFYRVYKDIEEEKKKEQGKSKACRTLYLYQAERLPMLLRGLGEERAGSCNDCILWQMITERLFDVQGTDVQGAGDPGVNLEPCRQLTVVEENAIHYAAGYVVHKLMKKHRQGSSSQSPVIIGALLNMVGHNTIEDTPQTTDSYLDYVKTWTIANDRGALQHVSDDTYRFFVAMEMITYKLLEVGETKEKVMCEVTGDENVLFLWELATDLSEDNLSVTLLRETVQEWFTIRGFSVASKLLEQYKAATKKNIKGTKGTRKELH